MSEAAIQQQIRLALSKAGVVAFRNNVAQAWVGQQVIKLQNGDVLIKNARPLHAGLCVGSSDLIGWTPVTVTPDMVGKTVAIFTACEVKAPNGRATEAQLNFISQVLKAGGFAGIARSPGDAVAITQQARVTPNQKP